MAFLLSLFSMFFVLTILFYNKNAKFVKQKKKKYFHRKKKKKSTNYKCWRGCGDALLVGL